MTKRLSGLEFANGIVVTEQPSHRKPSRPQLRGLTLRDIVGKGRVHVTFSPKGRDVTINIEGIEIGISFSYLRKFADQGCQDLTDVLIAGGWTPPPEPETDEDAPPST